MTHQAEQANEQTVLNKSKQPIYLTMEKYHMIHICNEILSPSLKLP